MIDPEIVLSTSSRLKWSFAEDKKLYLKKSIYWVQLLHQLKGLLNLQSLDISFLEFKLAIENYLRNKVQI
jgi:hypothetical protein